MGKSHGTTVEKQARTRRRALERHGVNLNNEDLLALREMITNNKATFIERESIDRSVWLIHYKGAEMVGVYSRRHGTLVTIFSAKDTEKFKARIKRRAAPPTHTEVK